MTDLIFSSGDIITICTWITVVSAASSVVVNLVNKAKKPTADLEAMVKEHTKRLDENDEKFKEYDKHFKNDYDRFKELEDGNKIILKGMLALLKHSTDGNDLEGIKRVEDDLEEYLINKN